MHESEMGVLVYILCLAPNEIFKISLKNMIIESLTCLRVVFWARNGSRKSNVLFLSFRLAWRVYYRSIVGNAKFPMFNSHDLPNRLLGSKRAKSIRFPIALRGSTRKEVGGGVSSAACDVSGGLISHRGGGGVAKVFIWWYKKMEWVRRWPIIISYFPCCL